jgi:hypothetical protein
MLGLQVCATTPNLATEVKCELLSSVNPGSCRTEEQLFTSGESLVGSTGLEGVSALAEKKHNAHLLPTALLQSPGKSS